MMQQTIISNGFANVYDSRVGFGITHLDEDGRREHEGMQLTPSQAADLLESLLSMGVRLTPKARKMLQDEHLASPMP